MRVAVDRAYGSRFGIDVKAIAVKLALAKIARAANYIERHQHLVNPHDGVVEVLYVGRRFLFGANPARAPEVHCQHEISLGGEIGMTRQGNH